MSEQSRFTPYKYYLDTYMYKCYYVNTYMYNVQVVYKLFIYLPCSNPIGQNNVTTMAEMYLHTSVVYMYCSFGVDVK